MYFIFLITHLICALKISVFATDTVATSNKGLSIDINYRNNPPVSNSSGTFSGDLLTTDLPVPFLFIKPNQLEKVHQIAESALENESIIADTEDVYERIVNELDQRPPEEMIGDIIAKINKLEALKAQLGTEECVSSVIYNHVS
ncbi:conserved hypothetical protein [Theileria orientalis strain Shintoku]|uniref:Uncharacterized protein n=1 Tax=Theileria orientalis strain Shintoku TaxID=869250 RepID=J7MBZ5_THEOR|nr:conserved hypothetical protein [Theileria orientalis strain Shintoku]BAM38692.1 conserved hypothetical protein [Theileria orientalis strain Shintoku]|eukprot:XP_009688993.1 conserved hypothetical protein [Theileria orientalis strain Shintoku]